MLYGGQKTENSRQKQNISKVYDNNLNKMVLKLIVKMYLYSKIIITNSIFINIYETNF